jgi:hypothetical protein
MEVFCLQENQGMEMSNKKRVLLPCLLFCVFLYGCVQECEEQERQNCAFVLKDGIEYYLQTDKYTYDTGESVEILFRLTNKTMLEKLVGDWPNLGAQMPVYVVQDCTDIYRLPPTPYEITNYYLGPGESCEYTMKWDMQTWPEHQPVEPGRYTVAGECNGAAASVTIEILE